MVEEQQTTKPIPTVELSEETAAIIILSTD